MSGEPIKLPGGAPTGALLCVVAFAGFAGAAGVALGAVAAHKVDSPALATAAMMLIVHAAAGLALAGIATRLESGRRWIAAACVMLFAASLFTAAIAFHTFTGNHLFPMAAPIGGSTLIASWLGVALLAALDWRRLR